jgi:protein-S-isoprenylcysteine O-methyltransferase Ste14
MDSSARRDHLSRLRARAARITATLLVTQAVPLFLSAGKLSFWQGWTYLGLQLVTMAATNEYLAKNDPALLERRLKIEEAGETDRVQRQIIAGMRVLQVALLVLSGLAHRFGWWLVGPPITALGSALFLAGAALIFRVFQANSYTSSVIEVAPEQPVVTTGPYRLVRHPMYTGVLLMGLATPVLLGSLAGETLILPMLALLVVRILAEERFLVGRLSGYAAYLERTPKRLIPAVW